LSKSIPGSTPSKELLIDEILNAPLPLAEGWQVAARHANGYWLTAVTRPGHNGYDWTKRLLDVEKFPSEAAAREALASTDADLADITMIRIPPNYREVPTLKKAA
jgi:hypothetical protein